MEVVEWLSDRVCEYNEQIEGSAQKSLSVTGITDICEIRTLRCGFSLRRKTVSGSDFKSPRE